MTKTATAWRFRFDGADPVQLMARAAFVLCGLIAAVTLIFALRMYAPLFSTPTKPTTPPAIDATLSRWSPEAIEADPVLVANPFDASEVFEFPHGTTTSEARAAISETLMNRARQRYAQLDAKIQQR